MPRPWKQSAERVYQLFGRQRGALEELFEILPVSSPTCAPRSPKSN